MRSEMPVVDFTEPEAMGGYLPAALATASAAKIEVQSPLGPYSSCSILAQPPRSAIVNKLGREGLRSAGGCRVGHHRPETVFREDPLPLVRDEESQEFLRHCPASVRLDRVFDDRRRTLDQERRRRESRRESVHFLVVQAAARFHR